MIAQAQNVAGITIFCSNKCHDQRQLIHLDYLDSKNEKKWSIVVKEIKLMTESWYSPDSLSTCTQSTDFCPIPVCSLDRWPLWKWPGMLVLWPNSIQAVHHRILHWLRAFHLDPSQWYTKFHSLWNNTKILIIIPMSVNAWDLLLD